MFINAKIETDRLIIRPYQLDDVDALYEVVSEPNFYKYVPEEIPTREGVKRIIEWSINCNSKNNPEKIYKFNLVIFSKEDNQLIGYCGLGPYDLNSSKIELYYGISEKYRVKGLAKETAISVSDYRFRIIGLNEIVTTVHPDNTPSLKILEKIRFTSTSTLKNMSKEDEYFEGYDYYLLTKEKFEQHILV
ncbi:GNAT family N-acetyltransferase [Bacillus sp. CGMCC 1.16607]|uniref:GNAT family N-acetyltransferase n=1 Tax=Bacillus sp. CGMCC 1.16607 TaxID=3351842 RepID=UPI00362A75A3